MLLNLLIVTANNNNNNNNNRINYNCMQQASRLGTMVGIIFFVGLSRGLKGHMIA
jgi:uncharacterized membrane protein YciS (DUF1049 family)